MRSAPFLPLLLCAALAHAAPGAHERAVAEAKARWATSPHGPMLERILPPGYEPRMLPEPDSRGAALTVRYCVQCHNLPNPAMHHAVKWQKIVERMALRMHGRGNMGELMHEMMAGVKAPSAVEEKALVAYMRKHSQKPLDPKRYPEVNQPSGEPFKLACQQCHVLPDPQRHTADEWRRVVARMKTNMEWMNRVVGTRPIPGEPNLRIEDIEAFLAKYARKP